MDSIHFFLQMDKIPTVTAQQKGERIMGGRIVHYDKKRVKDAKSLFMGMLMDIVKHITPYERGVPLQLDITFYYPWKGPKRGPAAKWKTTKPDADNIAKTLIDCMTRTGFWWDDGQISTYRIRKVWANTSCTDKFDTGINIEITPLKEEQLNVRV